MGNEVGREIRLTCFFALLIISLALVSSSCLYGVAQTSKEKLDVVLIIDNSSSTKDYDPHQLRIKAAQAFIGYLRLNEDKIDVRVAVVSFSCDARVAIPLTPALQDADIRTKFDANTYAGTCTNFAKAFQQAYSTFANSSPDRLCAYVLFTDGRPDLGPFGGDPWPDIAGEIGKFRLSQKSCQLYVMGIGDAHEDASKWQEFAGGPWHSKKTGALIQGYHQLDSIDNIYEEYRNILEDMTGRSFGEVCPSGTEEGSFVITVEPYLQKIIFAIVKWEGPSTTVEIQRPDGTILHPGLPNVDHTGGGSSNWDEGFSVIKPTPGKWRIIAKGGSVSCWADRYFLKIKKLEPGTDIVAGGPLVIKAQLVDPDGNSSRLVEGFPRYITANIMTKAIGGIAAKRVNVTPLALAEDDTGTFTAEYRETLSAGRYMIELTAEALGVAQPIDAQQFDLNVIVLPRIRRVESPDVEVKQSATVRVFVDNAREDITPDLKVLVDWQSGSGLSAGHLISCKRSQETNEFTCDLGALEEAQSYSSSVFLQGRTTTNYVIDGTRDPRFMVSTKFCVNEPRDLLPLPGKPVFSKAGATVARPEQGKATLIRVPITALDKTTPGNLSVRAVILDQARNKTQELSLQPNGKTAYEGELGPIATAGSYTATVSVAGITLYGCLISLRETSLPFVVEKARTPPPPLWRFWLERGVMTLLVVAALYGICWKLFFASQVKVSVGGRLIVTDPSGRSLEPFHLSGRRRIKIGKNKFVPLPEANGTVAELRAQCIKRRKVVRSLWLKGDRGLMKNREIYHGDQFSILGYIFKYENLNARKT